MVCITHRWVNNIMIFRKITEIQNRSILAVRNPPFGYPFERLPRNLRLAKIDQLHNCKIRQLVEK
jgi:hypothetical protein